MTPTLKLPIAASVASLSVLAVVELFLRPIADPIPLVLAVHVVLFGTLLALPRAPTLVVGLLLLEIFVIRHFEILEAIGMAGGLLTLFTATFAAAALVPTRKVIADRRGPARAHGVAHDAADRARCWRCTPTPRCSARASRPA